MLFQNVIIAPSKRDTQSQCYLKICDEKSPANRA